MTIEQSQQQTRDNLGESDETKNLVLIGLFKEKLGIEEGATQLTQKTYSGSDGFILGHSTYGVLGTSTLGTPASTSTVQRVVNPNNTFHEHFRFTTFKDATNTTADFSTTNYSVVFDINEVYQTLEIFKNVESITFVTLDVSLNGGSVTFSATGESATVNVIEGKESTQ